jgi:xylan 1,4-beta-xylosidase
LVETQGGEIYMVYLCGRPLRNRGRCTLGRETAIQKMTWGTDDWLRTLNEQGIPTVETPAPGFSESPGVRPSSGAASSKSTRQLKGSDASHPTNIAAPETGALRYDFNEPQLPIDFQWLRTPWPEEIFSLTVRPGFLRLFGRETIGSLFRQSLVARRQQSHCFSASTLVEFEPDHFQHMAGLVCYYNSSKFHYLYISHDESVGKHLRVMSCLPDSTQTDAFTSPIAIPAAKPVHLRVEVDFERLHFGYRVEGADKDWRWLPQQFDASVLSDEATTPGLANFTGAFVGMACQDLAGTSKSADFDFFEYRNRDYRPNPFLPSE